MKAIALAAVLSATSLLASAARAQAPAGFYAGKTLEIYAGTSAGAGYDLYARLLARHMGKHLPGAPQIVVKNMTGAGGVRLANWLASAAPADGTAIGTFSRGVAFDQLLKPKSVTVDGRRLNWIGSISDEVSVCVAWHTSGVSTFDDVFARELTVGATGASGDTYIFAAVLNGVLNTKLKIVSGYPGGNEISLALERGEVQGRCGWSWSSLKAVQGKWVQDGQMKVLAQIALDKHPDLPNVPLALDYAKSPEQRDALSLVFARQAMAWPYAAPPATPPERLRELRAAFDAALTDPALLAEANKSNFEVRPVGGAQIEALLKRTYAVAPEVVARAAASLK